MEMTVVKKSFIHSTPEAEGTVTMQGCPREWKEGMEKCEQESLLLQFWEEGMGKAG